MEQCLGVYPLKRKQLELSVSKIMEPSNIYGFENPACIAIYVINFVFKLTHFFFFIGYLI